MTCNRTRPTPGMHLPGLHGLQFCTDRRRGHDARTASDRLCWTHRFWCEAWERVRRRLGPQRVYAACVGSDGREHPQRLTVPARHTAPLGSGVSNSVCLMLPRARRRMTKRRKSHHTLNTMPSHQLARTLATPPHPLPFSMSADGSTDMGLEATQDEGA